MNTVEVIGELVRFARERRLREFYGVIPPPMTEASRPDLRLVPRPPQESVEAIFDLPVAGRVSSEYGVDRGTHKHGGIDIAAPLGTPVHATGDGKVILAGWVRGYGQTVIIQHSERKQTLYGHFDSLLVDAGDHVRAGDTIGLCGSTGRSTGPHVHYEVRVDGVAVNPRAVL